MRKSLFMITKLCVVAGLAAPLAADETIAPISQRFSADGVEEVPSFQKHVVPLFGRLGCNGRACHGSFQGRGGFRLSLFGYDFKADHEALFAKDSPRVDPAKPLDSLIITKPTDADLHEGGQRYAKDSWQYHVLRRWIEGGAKFDESDVKKLTTLEVTPSEIQFNSAGQTVTLKAVAVWADGSREDVTPLCRFQTNDDQVAKIDQEALVTAAKAGDTHLVISYDKAVITVPVLRPVSDLVADKYPATPAPTKIDELVIAKLKKLGVVQADLCTDAEFLRRVSLDITGTLPTADEVRKFLADTSADKRKKKVDELLETPAYAAWWTTKLCDYTGNNDEKLNNVGPVRGRVVQDWWDWINKRVADNTPYDQLATGIILSTSREAGEDYLAYCKTLSEIDRDNNDDRTFAERKTMPYYWSRNNVGQPEEKAISFAYAFMGARIECAQCHKHPFDQWSKDDFDQFKKFFTAISGRGNTVPAEVRGEYNKLSEEVGLANVKNNGDKYRVAETLLKEGKTIPFGEVYVTKSPANNNKKANPKAKNARPTASATARLLGGAEFELAKLDDPRQPLMDWLRDKNNPYFARSFANRVWAQYFNVGIVTPTDDMNLANPPSNKLLLDYLTEGFIASGFDMKWLHREIANSRTYQLSWVTNETNKLDERNFSHAVPRRLPAEVALDAVYTAAIADERANTMRTDLKNRKITIAGSSARINARAEFALGVFGRSTRESNCDCDRSMEASLLQTVYLQNDNEVSAKLGARDSWVSQVTLELAKSKDAADGADDKSSSGVKLVAEMKAIERKLERLRKQKNDEQVTRLEKQLSQLRKELTAQKKKESDTKELQQKVVADAKVIHSLIETAYLRTLSRFPAASDVKDGLTDVMWALVNTKEFIVNH
jgi:hypothetical protein